MKQRKTQVSAQIDQETLAEAKAMAELKSQSLSEYICDAMRWQVNHDVRRVKSKKDLYTGKKKLIRTTAYEFIDYHENSD